MVKNMFQTPDSNVGIGEQLVGKYIPKDTMGIKDKNSLNPTGTPTNSFGIAPETSWQGLGQEMQSQYNKMFPQSQEQAAQLAKATGSKLPATQVGMGDKQYAPNSPDISIGEIAAKYETSGKGVGFISTGMGGKDPGGVSYGNYQLETNKGTMQEYLKSKEGGAYAQALNQYPVNSQQFKQEWKKLATQDPDGFNKSQFDYLANKKNGYNEAVGVAEKMGIDVSNPAMQQALYSTVNQSGGWKHILRRANIKPGDDIRTQINKLYDGRASYFKQIKDPKLDVRLKNGSTIRKNIIKNRTIDERNDVLKLLDEQGI
jgi:hypothetical protein